MESGIGSRLEDLESRLAFQDDLIESLNEIIARQDRELLQLGSRVKSLEQKLSDLSDSGGMPGALPGDEIPPHY